MEENNEVEEYLLVFERNDGATAILRVVGTFEVVSAVVSSCFSPSQPDVTTRCYISKLIKVLEVSPLNEEKHEET